jgi:cytochrome c-type biogenesis protein CcmE
MKKSHILGLVVLAVAVMVIVSTAGDASSYVNFGVAKQMAEEGNNKLIHVVGELKKNEAGEVVGLQISDDKLSFRFIMVDDEGREEMVYYNEPLPTDFVRSEQVVVVGNFKETAFVADKILMKCPSKYEETKL